MIGIILTVVAVLFVICFAFYYSDSSSNRGHRADAFFLNHIQKAKKSFDHASSQGSRHSGVE